MFRSFLSFILLVAVYSVCAAETPAPMLLGSPTANRSQIAFSYAGSIWITDRKGGDAHRLTSQPGDEYSPLFSPDGSWIAFSKDVGGNRDIYVISATGGEARRLTYHPKLDMVRGWTPDGKNVLFFSQRDEEFSFYLYTIPAEGGFPSRLPLPQGFDGSYSPDGSRIAYTPYEMPDTDWRYYRGGLTAEIWIARLSDGQIEKIPTGNYSDKNPMWVGDRLYFLSDRTATFNLFVYDLKTKKTSQLTSFEKYGIGSASVAGDAIIFARDGRIHLYDLKSGQTQTVALRAEPDLSETKAKTVNASRYIDSAALSSVGDRIAFGARGDAFIFDSVKGESHNLTQSSEAAERYPAFSPDRQWVAYFSDESGEYQLHIRPASGGGNVKKIAVEKQPSFYRELTWSSDSKKIAFTDKHLGLWYTSVDGGKAQRIDASPYSYQGLFDLSWSPDGRWLTYAKAHRNRLRAIYIYDTETGKSHQITDGYIHAESPVFDRSGKYLYFTSSVSAGSSEFGWAVLSGILARPLVTRRLHAIVLAAADPSPLLSNGQPNKEARLEEENNSLRIDFSGIDRRVVTFPLEARDYSRLAAGKAGLVYALVNEWPAAPGFGGGDESQTLYRFDISKPRNLEKMIENVREFTVSEDGGKLLYRKGAGWFLISADSAPKGDEGKLDLKSLELEVDPRAEWKQIYHEAWRIMRDYFYDPNHHGQNLIELERHYGEYLASVTRRRDLNSLINMALGHISVSHLGSGGGDAPPPSGPPSRTGLLGADYQIDRGRYKITRVLRSGHYNTSNSLLSAPLDQPGMNVKEGEYLIAVDGEQIDASKNLYSYFEGKAGRAVKITIGPNPGTEGARTFTMIPTIGEGGLRRDNWAQENRRRVEELSGGKLGYIYVPNFSTSGLEDFFRGIFGYRDAKEAIIIDQRFNGGGITSDWLIEMIKRETIYYYMFRDGDDIAVPTNPVNVPVILVINELNFSAAETFSFMFKLGKVGTIVGRRTAGGGIGPYVFTPRFIDGGMVQLPNRAAYDPHKGKWGIENEGVEPDIEVEVTPDLWRAGRDPQLEKAVEEALNQLKKHSPPRPNRPRYPVHK